MSFKSFQNDNVTLRQYGADAFGDDVVEDTITTKADVQYQRKNSFDNQGNIIEVNGTVFITPNSDLNAKTISELNKKWTLEVEGEERQLHRFERVRMPAKSNVSHYEAILR